MAAKSAVPRRTLPDRLFRPLIWDDRQRSVPMARCDALPERLSSWLFSGSRLPKHVMDRASNDLAFMGLARSPGGIAAAVAIFLAVIVAAYVGQDLKAMLGWHWGLMIQVGVQFVGAMCFGRLVTHEFRHIIARASVQCCVCPSCAYDLSTIPTQRDGCRVCPECGSAWNLDHPRHAKAARGKLGTPTA